MMNNAEIIKGIDMTIAGLEAIKTALAGNAEAPATAEAPKSKSVAKREKVQKEEAMNAPVAEDDGAVEEVVAGKFDVEQLKSMKYNDFKKLAASLGVKCTGTRDEIMERILALNVTVTADDAVVDEPAEEDEDAETPADEADAEDDGEEITAESYFPELDPDGLNDPEEMSEERKEAIEAKMDEILTDYSDGTLTYEEIQSYVEDNATDKEIDLLGDDYEDEDILKLYMELIKRTIDDDGVEHELGEDPYEVNGKDVCCGHVLKYVKKTNMYVCSHCGAEYEAE